MDTNRRPTSLRQRKSVDHRRLWLTLYRRDVEGARRLIERALKFQPPYRIYLRLFQPTLAMSGTMWSKGFISYRDEHFITHHVTQLMRIVRRELIKSPPTGPVALAVRVGPNHHFIGLRMVCDLLQWDNWQVRWTPQDYRGVLRDSLRINQPSALLLGIGSMQSICLGKRLIAEARRHGFRGVIVVGGSVIDADPSLIGQMGADLTARDGLELIRKFRHLGISCNDPTGSQES